MTRKLFASAALALTCASVGSVAYAETEISFYGGWQTSPHSILTGNLPGVGAIRKRIGWDGKSFAMPPYYGGRVTFWNGNDTGWGFELSHDKAYAGGDMAPEFSRLEFTDGHNIITVNYSKRWTNKWKTFTPYASVGLGVALPHVDITPAVGTSAGTHTYGYQLTGPAIRLTAGASYDLNERWKLFSEYQFTASDNDVDLDGGGDLHTRLITNAINFGVSYGF